ncbi:MAG: alpha-2-macroglobulin family protein, partial [Acidobacteriota bacterium]
MARRGGDLAFDLNYLSLYSDRRSTPAETTKTLIYSDRSIYRPGQKLYWKILVYRGRVDLGRLRPSAGAPASVWLEDGNGQRVAEATCVTNAFGTASGEFVIPASGRPLGSWRLRSSAEGFARVRVEEYKRPTFEVAVLDPAAPLRLNRVAVMKAEARYYFGLPVASGTAVWQVKREPVYPRWWWREAESGRSQTIAGGRARIKEDGTMEAAFTPRADERKAAAGISYRYTFSVEVTDEGGETRTANRSFRLGFVNAEARIEAETAFGTAGAANVFSIIRSDLNGTPAPGKGEWTLVRLSQPSSTLLPADLPMPEETSNDPGRGSFRTPGDSLRPRWESLPSLEAILRLWKEGPRAASGRIEHEAKTGLATATVPGLEPGAYRLLYETKDDFGAVCRESLDFLVAAAPASAAASSPGNTPLHLPLVISAERSSVPVGKTARIFIHSGFADQPLLLETFKGGDIWQRRWIEAGKAGGILEIPVTEDLRGGFGARLTAVRDHQFMSAETNVFVPWDNKDLALSFSTFRDKLAPGGRETWRIIVKTPGGKPAVQGAAELLAYMYDRSLDLFAAHRPPSVTGLYPDRTGTPGWDATLGTARLLYAEDFGWSRVFSFPSFRPDTLLGLDGYGIGGPGARVLGGVVGGVLGGVVGEVEAPRARMAKSVSDSALAQASMAPEKSKEEKSGQEAGAPAEPATQVRSNFAETAFWQPHLLTGADGTAAIEFTVPDSVTSWRVFVHAVTRDLAGGMLAKEARTVKELMVRPYLPRFFREGDKAELRVMVNNAGAADMAGEVALEIFDPETNENLAPAFGLPASVPARPFAVKAGGGSAVTFPLAAPSRVGTVAFKVTAKSGAFSDGELRPLPVLPGRMHLVQSRFATLKRDGTARELHFTDLAKNDDPTRINDRLVVTVDGQLFYGLLEALPYLVNYPYECTEQTLNRFLSTSILTSLYDRYPAVAKMALALAAKRDTICETFDTA